MYLIIALVAMIGILTVYNFRGIYKILDTLKDIQALLENKDTDE